MRVTLGQEMWTADKTPAQAALLLSTTNDLSDWSKDNINAQPITIIGIDSPALEWLLRGHQISTVSTLGASASPPFVITTDQNNPTLAAAYRGESFVWRQGPLWDNAAASDWMTLAGVSSDAAKHGDNHLLGAQRFVPRYEGNEAVIAFKEIRNYSMTKALSKHYCN